MESEKEVKLRLKSKVSTLRYKWECKWTENYVLRILTCYNCGLNRLTFGFFSSALIIIMML